MFQRCIRTLFISILLCGLVSIVTWIKGRDIILKHVIQDTLRKKSGLPIYISEVRSNIFLSKVEVIGTTVENPPNFSRRLLAYIPRLTIVSDLPHLLQKDRYHFFLLDFEIEEINIMKNANGVTNLNVVARMLQEHPKFKRAIASELVRFDIKDALFYNATDTTTKLRAYAIDAYDITFKNTNTLEDIVDAVIMEITSKALLGEVFNSVSDSFFSNIKDLNKVPSKMADKVMNTSRPVFALFFPREKEADQT